MMRELWPGPEQSLALILRLARPGGSRPEPGSLALVVTNSDSAGVTADSSGRRPR
jgi:hypothetical protein